MQLMPSDPIVNDHYANTLWMTGERFRQDITGIVLNLEKTEDDLKEINDKIINGPSVVN